MPLQGEMESGMLFPQLFAFESGADEEFEIQMDA